MENSKQSVNNYVYKKSRNKTPENNGNDDSLSKHDAIEIPFPKDATLSNIITIMSILVTFVLVIALCILAAVFDWRDEGMVTVGVLIFLAGIFTMALSMVLAPRTDRKQNLKVCKTRVRGRLVGYEKGKGYRKNHSSVTLYAPKYEIFINNRYEIRTLDDFRANKDFAEEIDLLANPDGYEIITAE